MSAAETCEVCRRHPWDGHKLDCPKRLAETALSSPPADDVHEALAFRFFAHESGQDEEFVRRVWANHTGEHPVKRSYFGMADALLTDAALEVRSRGTVTDSEPVAWALYGKVTGLLRHVTTDEEVAREESEFYVVRPLHAGEAHS